MKVAIIGTETERVRKVVMDAVAAWNGVFPTPATTVYDETTDWPTSIGKSREECEEVMGEVGAELYGRIMMISDQYEQYREEKNMLYSGSTLDIVANALFWMEKDPASITTEAMEKLIYWHKRLVRKLDLIYILPPEIKQDTKDDGEKPDDTETGSESTDTKPAEREKTEEELDNERLEQIYFALWLEYTDNFEHTQFFPNDDCPGIAVLESNDPISEMRRDIDSKGNLSGDGDPADIQKLFDNIRDPKILEEAKKILEKRSIPLVGVPQSNTIILQ